MKYLIILEGLDDFYLTDKISEDDIKNSEDGVMTIFNIEDKTFHVEGKVWQKIKENNG